ncbi:MAG: acyltransferase [Tannerellaceae bacterium]|jgi:peptidoglycan/LPS O-acetylase OafA/YrhL|nr:acyltransferase [Tannerellaceae bacterium]
MVKIKFLQRILPLLPSSTQHSKPCNLSVNFGNNIHYFTGLNALRFWAAYFVVLHHAEQIRMKYGMFNLKEYALFNNGGIAVTFFFVLSGFLITYLLLQKQYNTNEISVKQFYIRRILRIWPLYFLLVFLGALLVPYLVQSIGYSYEMPYGFKNVIGYFVFFMPFMVNIKFGHHLLEPLWSIGVEELFYLVWAPLFKWLKRHILAIILSVILIKICVSVVVFRFEIQNTFSEVLGALQFEAMAMGGLGAYIIFHRKKEISESGLFSLPVQLFAILFLLLHLLCRNYLTENSCIFRSLFQTPIASNFLLIAIFVWLIINTSLNRKAIIRFHNKYLNFLGEISYGIYMYHMLVVFGIIWMFKDRLNCLGSALSTIVFYLLLTTGVIFVSYLSKIRFEDYFLKLKSKFNK